MLRYLVVFLYSHRYRNIPLVSDQANRVLELVREAGVLRPHDLEPMGIPRTYLSRLDKDGRLEQIGRGLYVLPSANATELRILAEAAKRVPKGVICLLSALRYHELTTQTPFEIWITIGEKAWRTRVDQPRLRVIHFSGTALNEGGIVKKLVGVPVRIFNPAKTVADCFKYRNKIGLDVAIKALRECWKARRCKMDDLWHYADVCRAGNVMRPYLEVLTA